MATKKKAPRTRTSQKATAINQMTDEELAQQEPTKKKAVPRTKAGKKLTAPTAAPKSVLQQMLETVLPAAPPEAAPLEKETWELPPSFIPVEQAIAALKPPVPQGEKFKGQDEAYAALEERRQHQIAHPGSINGRAAEILAYLRLLRDNKEAPLTFHFDASRGGSYLYVRGSEEFLKPEFFINVDFRLGTEKHTELGLQVLYPLTEAAHTAVTMMRPPVDPALARRVPKSRVAAWLRAARPKSMKELASTPTELPEHQPSGALPFSSNQWSNQLQNVVWLETLPHVVADEVTQAKLLPSVIHGFESLVWLFFTHRGFVHPSRKKELLDELLVKYATFYPGHLLHQSPLPASPAGSTLFDALVVWRNQHIGKGSSFACALAARIALTFV